MAEPTFSVILPTFHGGDLLRSSLAALRALQFPPDRFEVLVPCPADNQDVPKIVREAAADAPFRLECVGSAAATRAGAANAAIAQARGRYLAFADDDVFVEPDWLANLDRVFTRQPEAGLVGGMDRLDGDVGPFDLAFDAVLHSVLGGGRIRMGAGLRLGQYYPRMWSMALPRAVAMEAAIQDQDGRPQVFNPALAVHEDVELGERVRRLGRAIIFAPEVKVRHRRKTTLAAVTRRDFQAARTCRAEGLHAWPHRILSAGLVAVIVVAIGAVFWWPLRVALAAMVIGYAAVLAAVGIIAAVQKRRLAVLALAPLIAASLHLARASGYLLARRKTRQEPKDLHTKGQSRQAGHNLSETRP